VDWDNSRTNSNSPDNSLSPQLYTSMRFYVQQQLLAALGLGPNLRFLRIGKTNRKISDTAFSAQLTATVTQVCDLYWDLVNAYDHCCPATSRTDSTGCQNRLGCYRSSSPEMLVKSGFSRRELR
jgi:hypothetical protein